jgi:sterol desaturase/sphingolipid hydroxylase (fatty acid hydroxylase superfamily)
MNCAKSHERRGHLAASPRLFRNPLLDRLSRVHPATPFLLYLPAIGILLWRAGMPFPVRFVMLAFASGYLMWTLVEYFGHRFVFHIRPKNALGRRIQFLIHGVHHKYPNDPLRLVMPPLMSVPIMAAAFVVFRFAAGSATALPAMAGFIAGYLAYDGLHFYLHHASATTALGRYLQQRHLHHHFRDESTWFGVSAWWWDGVFATRPLRAPGVGRIHS